MKLKRRSSGSAEAAELLLSDNILQKMKERKIEYVYFSGMENVLEKPLDPFMLGRLVAERKEMAAKCLANPSERFSCLPRYAGFLDFDTKVNYLSS